MALNPAISFMRNVIIKVHEMVLNCPDGEGAVIVFIVEGSVNNQTSVSCPMMAHFGCLLIDSHMFLAFLFFIVNLNVL